MALRKKPQGRGLFFVSIATNLDGINELEHTTEIRDTTWRRPFILVIAMETPIKEKGLHFCSVCVCLCSCTQNHGQEPTAGTPQLGALSTVLVLKAHGETAQTLFKARMFNDQGHKGKK